MNRINLVDPGGRRIGGIGKLEAHRRGVLHEAFSIFVFNGRGELLLQQRAAGKYHSGGQWTNTCCSHARENEDLMAAAHRRLREEMGFDGPLEERFAFTYRADVPGGLIEHEYDHVFVGYDEGAGIDPDPAEVASWRWIGLTNLEVEMVEAPERFTAWLRILADDERLRKLFPHNRNARS